jgi:hypothetical protein
MHPTTTSWKARPGDDDIIEKPYTHLYLTTILELALGDAQLWDFNFVSNGTWERN